MDQVLTIQDHVRERIILAGHRLLGDSGLDGLTVRAVLLAASVNRRLFYERFADKDALVVAVFTHAIRLLTSAAGERMREGRDPLARLRLLIDYIAVGDAVEDESAERRARRRAALCREHMRLAEARPAALREALAPLIALIADELATGVDNGQVRRDDPEQLAGLLYNLVSTTMHAALLAQEAGIVPPVDRQRLAEQIWSFCHRGVAA